jgi:hypothetical protein
MTAAPKARTVWTEAKVRDLGVRIDGVVAVEIVTGYARSTAYTLLRTPEILPFRVLKIGRRFVVPAADVLRALGLEPAADADTGPPNARAA